MEDPARQALGGKKRSAQHTQRSKVQRKEWVCMEDTAITPYGACLAEQALWGKKSEA